MAAGFGTSETKDWHGRRLKVSVERIPYRGKVVDAIKLAVPEKEEPDKLAVPEKEEADKLAVPEKEEADKITDDDIPF